MSDRNNFPSSFPIARLEKRTSAKGNEYFSGFLGGARVSLIKSNETGRENCEVWHLMIAEGKLYPTKGQSVSGSDGTGRDGDKPSRGKRAALRDYARPALTDDRAQSSKREPQFDQSIPF